MSSFNNVIFPKVIQLLILILILNTQLNSQNDTLIYNIDIKNPHKTAFCLKNNSNTFISFKLKLNNKFFYNDSEIVSYINSVYNNYSDELLYQKAWRFVIDNTIHKTPLTYNRWQHNPYIFLNSIGFGYCDDINTNLSILWKILGYESRVCDLNGHVVCEIKINDRWECYDADFGAYHINANNNVANIDELENNIDLFKKSNTIEYINHNSTNKLINTKKYISFYQTKDNHANNWYDSFPGFYPDNFNLPPNSILEFPGKYIDSIKTQFDVIKNTTSNAKLTIPKSWTGEIYQPLQLVAIEGKGKIKIDNISFEIGTKEFNTFLRKNNKILTSFELIESNSEIIAIYFVNPYLLKVFNNKLMLTGNNIDLIECNTINLNESEYIGYGLIDNVKIKEIVKKLNNRNNIIVKNKTDFYKKVEDYFLIENTDNDTKNKIYKNIETIFSKINANKHTVFYTYMSKNVFFAMFMHEIDDLNSKMINKMITHFSGKK